MMLPELLDDYSFDAFPTLTKLYLLNTTTSFRSMTTRFSVWRKFGHLDHKGSSTEFHLYCIVWINKFAKYKFWVAPSQRSQIRHFIIPKLSLITKQQCWATWPLNSSRPLGWPPKQVASSTCASDALKETIARVQVAHKLYIWTWMAIDIWKVSLFLH